MSSIISKYKKQIQGLKPLEDSKFRYDSNRWSKLNTIAKKSVLVFENKEIARKDVIKAFEEYFQGSESYLYPFTLTMIWGFADTGYGTFRTNKYLSSNENKAFIKSAFNEIIAGDISNAYHLLMKVNGLNVSYISKLLYFGTKARKQLHYALIFDIRVARSLVKISDLEGFSGFLNISPSNKYEDYNGYNMLIHRWAKELKVKAENIEMFLFNGDF
ncbi:hypothetical protein N9K15_02105 [Maribacter arcticus]|nr:hypothetical protein [Maribacter arcticus]MDA9089716.1 hypothetical protein [Maribacter arcticus]